MTTPHMRLEAWPGAVATVSVAATRAAGLIADQEYGLLPYLPILALLPWGSWHIWRHDRRALAIISMSGGAYVASVLLPFVNTHGWTGGWTPAGRFLVIVVPLLALPLAYGLRTAPRTVTATLLALQLAIDVYFWSAPKNLWNDGDGIAAVCERGPLRVCGWLPSFVGPDDKVMTVSE